MAGSAFRWASMKAIVWSMTEGITSTASNLGPAGPVRSQVLVALGISVTRRSLIHTNGGMSSEALIPKKVSKPWSTGPSTMSRP